MVNYKLEMTKNVIDLIESSTVAITGAMNPVAGVIMSIATECSHKVDNIKLMYIVDSLGKGLNEETFKNMLVNYIRDSNERAILVVDTFRKVLLQDSIISSTLMGILLAKNIGQNSDYSHEDLILFKALQVATDIDLIIFRKLIKSGKLKNDENMDKRERLTCRWCVQQRIFEEHIMEFNIKEKYTATIVSEKLNNLMDEVPDYLWDE